MTTTTIVREGGRGEGICNLAKEYSARSGAYGPATREEKGGRARGSTLSAKGRGRGKPPDESLLGSPMVMEGGNHSINIKKKKGENSCANALKNT